MSTLYDVAELAGVSQATVSRILSEDPGLSVTQATREKVLEAARALQYRSSKRRFRGAGVEETVALRDIGLVYTYSGEEELRDPYYLGIRQGIEAAAPYYKVQARTVPYRLGQRVSLPQGLEHFIAVGQAAIDAVRDYGVAPEQLVCVDYAPNIELYDSVVVDFARATEQVLAHLFALGHERIGLLCGRHEDIVDSRQLHFERVMRERGRYNPAHVFVGPWSPKMPDSGYHLMLQALEENVDCTAFFVASDPLAGAALKALTERGIRVPEDIALVGFDDAPMSGWLRPALTTVRVHTEQMGRSAVALLSERLQGREIPLQVVVPTQLVIRESCGWSSSKADGQPTHV